MKSDIIKILKQADKDNMVICDVAGVGESYRNGYSNAIKFAIMVIEQHMNDKGSDECPV